VRITHNNLTVGYFVFYFLFTLGLIIKKSLVLSYPDDLLACDVGLLFLMAALECIHFCCGVKGNLTESEGYLFANLIATGTTIVLAVYFLVWQTYVMWGDVILSSILLVMYGLSGVLACTSFILIDKIRRHN
uniref:Transmembrane protein 80 n=1 Tax=Sphaeramia orbicularis TaxID=375764 RepID=A0A673A792_9TELE